VSDVIQYTWNGKLYKIHPNVIPPSTAAFYTPLEKSLIEHQTKDL